MMNRSQTVFSAMVPSMLAVMSLFTAYACAQEDKQKDTTPRAIAYKGDSYSIPPFRIKLGDNVANAVIAKVEQIEGETLVSFKLFDFKEKPIAVKQVTKMESKKMIKSIELPGGGTEEKVLTVQVPITTTVPNPRFIPTQSQSKARVATIQAYDLNGKPIEKKDWLKRLEQPKTVLLLKAPMDEKTQLDPNYSQLLRDDLLLLYLQRDEGQSDDK